MQTPQAHARRHLQRLAGTGGGLLMSCYRSSPVDIIGHMVEEARLISRRQAAEHRLYLLLGEGHLFSRVGPPGAGRQGARPGQAREGERRCGTAIFTA